LLLIGGLPGSGKSTLAQYAAQAAGFSVLRSDVIRKELAGPSPLSPLPPGERGRGEGPPPAAKFAAGIYTPEWTGRTYAEFLQRCGRVLWQGGRVLIDANFGDGQRRQAFFGAARRWGVSFLFIHCQAAPEITRVRLQSRRNDASDADWRIY